MSYESPYDDDRVLTQRQLDVLAGIRAAKTNKEIAHDLGLSEKTVKAHATALMHKLRARNRVQCAVMPPASYAHLVRPKKD